MGAFLAIKLVKPTKISSRATQQLAVNQRLTV
jgi:hypothetical protein